MEQLRFEFDASETLARRAQVGVVGSGNLEVLMEPAAAGKATVDVTTSQDGNGEIWSCVLQRFFEAHPVCAAVEINDFGATPVVVTLRLMQAWEACAHED